MEATQPRTFSKRTAALALLLAAALGARGALAADGEGELSTGRDGSGPELEVDTDLPMGPILLGSFSLVIVAVGAGFGWQADQEHDDWKAAKSDPMYAAEPEAGQERVDALADDVRKHSIAANTLMFGGLALLASSVIWWIVDAGGDEEESSDDGGAVAWYPAVGPGQASLGITF